MKFGAFLRLGRITALIVFAIILTGLGLCGSAAQPLPLTVLTASAPAMRTPQPISSLAPAALPTQRITKEAAAEWMQRAAFYANASANGRVVGQAPTPPEVAPQFQDLTTIDDQGRRPPFVGSSTRSFEKHPHWSWDQQFIYFASNHPLSAGVANYGTVTPAPSDRFHIYRMTSDGAFITQVTGGILAEANGEQTFPALNFAQTKLAYVQRDSTGNQQLWVLDFFNNQRTQITGPGANALNNPLNGNLRNVEHPSWSLNDNNITFSAVEATNNARNIYVVNVASKFVTRITNAATNSGINAKDPVYVTDAALNNQQIVFASNSGFNGVNNLNYVLNVPNQHDLYQIAETGGATVTRLTTSTADDIEPAFNRSVNAVGAPQGAFHGYMAWASSGRTVNGNTGTTYDIYFNDGRNETLGGTATPIRLFTPDTNGGSIALNQSEERYPTWSSGLPPQNPINRIAFSSNRTQTVVGSQAVIGVGNPLTESDIWVADAWDITPPTLFYYDPQRFPGEVLHIANQPLPNPGSRIGQPGDRFYFYARVLDGQYGVESVWVQIKDPDGPSTDAQSQNHRLYGVGSFPGGNGSSNNVFIVRRDGNGAPTHYMHVPFETDYEGVSASDYSYFVDGRPAAPNYPTRIDQASGAQTRARFASKNPGVDDSVRWSGNQISPFNPVVTSNRPPLDNQAIPGNRWLRLTDDGMGSDQVAGDNVYSAHWDTPLTGSDYYVDLIAYDKSFNPQNPSEQQNWIIYDNVHGFSTQAFTSTQDVLYVDDYGCGQKWPRGLKGSFRTFPTFRYGHESDVIDRPTQFHPRQWVGNNIVDIQDPSGTNGVESNETFDFLQNKYNFIGWNDAQFRGTLRAYQYDIWRILAKGPIPETVLNDYVPTRDEQPRRQPDGSYTTVQQPIPRRAVVWNAPYTGDVMAGGGTILDQATQAALTTYRNRSGRLVVAGGDILWALNLGQTGNVFNTFAQDVLGVQSFNGDASGFLANYSGSPLAQAVTRDVVDDAFRPGFPNPPFWWEASHDPEVLGSSSTWSGSNPPYGNNNTALAAVSDAIPFQTNDTYTPAAGWETVYDGKMSVNQNGTTQSKTVFLSQSLATMGRFNIAESDTAVPLVSMNYRAKISHAMFCWMFSADLTGQVVNQDKGFAPIGGAYVEAIQGGQVVGAAFTNSLGIYQIRGLPVGNWGLRVSSPGFISFNKSTSNGAHGLTRATEDFQLTEAPTGSISGQVVDQAGQAVPGVVIRAVLQAGPLYTGERNFFGTTGPDGRYVINNVPAGDPGVPAAYIVSVDQLPPLFANPAPAQQSANVVSATDTPNINFTVEGQPGPLTVGVFEDVNGAKGNPIAGAEVALLDAGNQLITTGVLPGNPVTTDASGQAVFTQVPAGPVTVVAFKPGYTEALQVVPIPQQNSAELLLRTAPIRPLYALVERAATGQPLQPEDLDTPVQIRLLRRLSRLPVATVNVSGTPQPVPGNAGRQYNVVFPNAQDGDYIVAFEDQNHPRFFGGAEVPVTITPTEPNIAPDLQLQGKTGNVTGVVKESTAGNPPIQGVTVTLTPTAGAPIVLTTNASGQFSTANPVASDLYTVTVAKFGYTSPAPINVFVAGDRDLGDILMTPSPRGEVYGLVTRSTDGVPRDVTVRFTPQGAPGVYYDVVSSTTTSNAPDMGLQNYTTGANTVDNTGTPSVNLPQGTYTISVLPDPRFSGFTVIGGNTVVVAGNDQQRKNITVNPASGTLTGTVRDANTNVAIQGAVVSVRKPNNQVVATVQTNASGQFTTAILPGGSYTLVVTHPNYENGNFPQVIEGTTTVTPNPLLLTPKPPSAISGTVRSKVDNTLIAGVTVQLLLPNGNPVAPAVTDTTSATLSSNPTRNYRLFPVSPGDYIVRVSKSGWKPLQQSVTVLPGADRTGINFLLDPEHLFGAGLLLISLPDDYGSQDAAALLNLGTGERTAYWLTDQNRYAIFPNEEEARYFTPGKGMFVRLNSPRAFFQSGTPVANAPFNISLKSGWNLIGSPRRQRIEWLKVKVVTGGGQTLTMQDAMNQGVIQNGLFGYVDGYFRSDTLDPFRGYFVRAYQPCTLVIPVDNTSASAAPRGNSRMAEAGTPSLSQVAAELRAAGLAPRARLWEPAPALQTLYNRLQLPQAMPVLSARPWITRAG